MTADVIRSILKGNPLTFAHIGYTWGDPAIEDVRCFRSTPPPDLMILPYVTYHDSTGLLTNPRVAKSLTFNVVSWGSDETECVQVADDVEKAIDGFSGTVDGIEIDGIELKTFRDALEEKTTSLWYSIRTFEMIYRR